MTSHNAVPPDGGWGWVFVAGCALQWFFHGGLVKSFSLIYEQMLVRFGASASATGAVYSFNLASALLTAPLSAALSTRVTPRQGVLIGTALMFTGFLATAFATSLPVVYFTFGIMGGTGSGVIATMRFITTPLWFRKNLGRATSLILMTDGLGTMAMGPLLDFMFGYYGYTGTMMFLASISLHGLIVAMVMIPIPHPCQQTSNPEIKVKNSMEHDYSAEDKKFYVELPQAPGSGTHSSRGGLDEDEELTVKIENGVSRSSIAKPDCTLTESTTNISTEDDVVEQLPLCELETSNNTPDNKCNANQLKDVQTANKNCHNLKNRGEALHNGKHPNITRIANSGLSHQENGGSPGADEPVTHNTSSHCDGCLSKFYSYLDVRLLRSSSFFAFSLLMTSNTLCSAMANTHMAGMAIDRSVAPKNVAILLTVVGGLAVLVKFSAGFLYDLHCFKAVRNPVFGALGATGGLLLILIPLTSGAPMFAFMWVLNQLALSAFITQESAILNNLVPRKHFASAIGLSRFFRGLGVIIGPTLGGFLKDITGNYNSTLFFGGSIFLFASLIFEMIVLRRHTGICKSTRKTSDNVGL